MNGKPLNPPQMEEAAAAIAAGEKTGELIKRLGISRRTLTRWKAVDQFRQRVNEIRTEMSRECCGRFATTMADAADTLSGLLKSDNECVKLGASRQLLALGMKIRDLFEIEERIHDVEEKMSKSARK